jgi:hypothetical protein
MPTWKQTCHTCSNIHIPTPKPIRKHSRQTTTIYNQCNETLQGTFNRQIFEAELDLFRSEGLLGRASGNQQEAVQAMERMRDAITISSRACLELLFGHPTNRATRGILQVITAQGQVPDPSDQKLIQALHRGFKGRDKFVKVHPRDMHRNFIIAHYAGEVAYSVGSFLKKDADRAPGEMDALLNTCNDETVRLILLHSATVAKRASLEGKTKKKKRAATTITSKFSGQVFFPRLIYLLLLFQYLHLVYAYMYTCYSFPEYMYVCSFVFLSW